MEFGKMDMEDLLADESFINYCKQTVPGDIARWEAYLREHPDDAICIGNAKTRFAAIFNAMAMADRDEQEALLKSRLTSVDPAPIVQMQGYEDKKNKHIFSMLLKLTAAVAVVIVAGYFILKNNDHSGKEGLKIFAAAYGERKNFQLPDGSVVILNAGSKMHIDERYGISTRDIYLEGEAFFDVKHNKALPFIVHTPAMDVKALGTAFNVKAYPGEKMTETSLVRGIVEVTLKEEKNRKVLLYPNEKVQWKQPSADEAAKEKKILLPQNLVQSLTKTDRNEIKEIAWTENKLVFADETFADIAILLERWYGVKIEFADEVTRNYRFTGIFEKEEIGAVLSFLKESRDFNYEIIQGNTLTVKIHQ
jgi:ferric-dicitrate binding protein FerR (iron transport regulator)